MLLSADQDGSVVAHGSGVHRFPGAGQPVEVSEPLGAHLLSAGGFTRHDSQREGNGTMYLSKDQGGSSVKYQGVEYAWAGDGDATEVPPELAEDLLRLGGYQVAATPEPEPGTEPESTSDSEPEAEPEGGDEPGDGEAPKPSRRSRASKPAAPAAPSE